MSAGKDVVAHVGAGKVEGKVGSDLGESRPVVVVIHDNDGFHELRVGEVGVVRVIAEEGSFRWIVGDLEVNPGGDFNLVLLDKDSPACV